jgi:hypothetical protein
MCGKMGNNFILSEENLLAAENGNGSLLIAGQDQFVFWQTCLSKLCASP